MTPKKFLTSPKKTNQFRTITFFTNKGGSGKTTSALMIATILTAKGFKVLMIDNDGQGNTSGYCGASPIYTEGIVRTEDLYHQINVKTPNPNERIDIQLLASAIQVNPLGFGFIESSKRLDEMKMILKGEYTHFTLARIGEAIRNAFDFCVIDTSCSQDIISANGIMASDDIIVTVAPEGDTARTMVNTYYSLDYMGKLYEADTTIDRVLVLKVKPQQAKDGTVEEIKNFAREHYKCKSCTPYIKYATAIDSAVSAGEYRLDCIKSERDNEAFVAYVEVVEEYLKDHGISDNSDFKVMEFPIIKVIENPDESGKYTYTIEESGKKKIVTNKKDITREYTSAIRRFLGSEEIESEIYIEPGKNKDDDASTVLVEMGKKKGKRLSNNECHDAVSEYLSYTGLEYSVRRVIN